jgi:hypothetical protein
MYAGVLPLSFPRETTMFDAGKHGTKLDSPLKFCLIVEHG